MLLFDFENLGENNMSEEQAVIVERQGRVMVITLNRPDAMNAINGALSNGLWTAIQELDADDSLVAGVITGSGRAFFSSARCADCAINNSILQVVYL